MNITTDTILSWYKEQVSNKRPISPDTYLDMAMKLNILRSDEDDVLIGHEHMLAVMRQDLLEKGETASSAKMHIEADPLYMEAQSLKAKLKRIEEIIRLSKKHAQIKSDEMRSGL